MSSLTVTASEASAVAWYMRVLVLTGATEMGGASVLAYNPPNNPITPNGPDSLIVWALENFTSATVLSPVSDNTALDSAAGAEGDSYAHGYYSGTVTAGDAVTVGCASGDAAQFAAYEILASGGSIPAMDGSAPELATATAASVTSSSFSPPAGAVLAALIACYDTAGTISPAVSGGGLTWTQQALLNQFSQTFAAVYTATVPSGAAASPSGLLMAGIV